MAAEHAAKEPKPQAKIPPQREGLTLSADQQPALDVTHPDPAMILQLQGTVGNRAVQRIVAPGGGGSSVDNQKMNEFKTLLQDYQKLREDGALSAEQTAEADQAIDKANDAVNTAQSREGTASGLYKGSVGAVAVAGTLVADDITVVGAVDDIGIPPALVVAGALALGGLVVSQFAKSASSSANQAITEAIEVIGQIVMAAKVGDQVRSWTNQLAIHLARFLGTAVGGRPPDHQEDPEKDRPHWWTEIKNFLKQIKDKGLSPKQLMRELSKKFSEAELAEIREALRKVAEKMGEEPPDFPPTAAP